MNLHQESIPSEGKSSSSTNFFGRSPYNQGEEVGGQPSVDEEDLFPSEGEVSSTFLWLFFNLFFIFYFQSLTCRSR